MIAKRDAETAGAADAPAPPEDRPGVLFQAFTWSGSQTGTFWTDLAEQAPALASDGFTGVWLPPACKGSGGADDVGYAVYDLYDLGEFDQKGGVATAYGTRAELEACVAACHAAGLDTFADVVLNHRMGADAEETFEAVPVHADNREAEAGEPREITAWTRFEFPGRGDHHSSFEWRWHHFSAVDLEVDDESSERQIFRVTQRAFSDDVGAESGNADYLMGCNIDHGLPDVRSELFDWAHWFQKHTGVSGFRIDAAKHISAAFLKDLLGHLRQETGSAMVSVAEFATTDRSEIQQFIERTEGAIHVFDFPLQKTFFEFAEQIEAGNAADIDLRRVWEGSVVESDPASACTFVDNHDTDPAQEYGGWVSDAFKPQAYALILMWNAGWPCVYRGDYTGPHAELLRALLAVRRDFGYGDLVPVFDRPEAIAWVRTGTEDHPGAAVTVISRGDEQGVRCATGRPDTTFRSALPDDDREIRTDASGDAEFPAGLDGVGVWVTV